MGLMDLMPKVNFGNLLECAETGKDLLELLFKPEVEGEEEKIAIGGLRKCVQTGKEIIEPLFKPKHTIKEKEEKEVVEEEIEGNFGESNEGDYSLDY